MKERGDKSSIVKSSPLHSRIMTNPEQDSRKVLCTLIVATMGRTSELSRLFASLERQTQQSFEVVVVDQNGDNRLVPILAPWTSRFPVHHLRSQPGLSRARNVGLKVATGELVAFPDDDCWYPDDTLQKISAWFNGHSEFDFLSGCARTEDHRLTGNRWLTKSCEIRLRNVFRSTISITLFVRRDAMLKLHGFDESLGLGSGTTYGSGEESDCVFRLLAAGSKGWYERGLIIHHSEKSEGTSEAAQVRARSYGIGFGYLLRRHKLPVLYSLYYCMRPSIKWLIKSLYSREQAAVCFASFRGRLTGYFHSS